MARHSIWIALALCGGAAAASAQATGGGPQQQQPAPPLNAVDEAVRQARIAVTGDLGLPALAPLLSTSPMTSILYADRVPVGQEVFEAEGPAPEMIDDTLPGNASGTGTGIPEIFQYQLPADYDADGPPHGMLVAYHGFGSSHKSAAKNSTLDEECNARSLVYLAPTGLDDQLFGSPPCMQHVVKLIQWMIDNFNVDASRLYMVGFSMGGGVVSNFAARPDDMDGISIAAVGVVSATMDWTLEHTVGVPAIQTLLEHAYNFGGPPSEEADAYKLASTLYFEPPSYPPTPGTLDALIANATKLDGIPVYVTYDTDDAIAYVPSMNDDFCQLLESEDSPVKVRVRVDTISPTTGEPAPHSWAVLDESEMLDWFESKASGGGVATVGMKGDEASDPAGDAPASESSDPEAPSQPATPRKPPKTPKPPKP